MYLPLWFLSGCASISWCERFNLTCEEGVLREEAIDQDEDVWTASDDCDDNDPYTYPYAPELCDDIDNNCDGLGDIEEGLAVLMYFDSDGDGYGDSDNEYFHCYGDELPSGWVENSEDCDDNRPWSYPEAPELCDSEDNDCDGDVDEDALLTFYIDSDGDGSGSAEKTIEACLPPDGYTIYDGDCDDDDSDRFPAADEQCDNIDNNCNEEIDEEQCVSSLSSSGILLSGEDVGDRTGNALSGAGDLNADGYDDILIGAHGVGEDAGAVYVVYGPVTANLSLDAATARLLGAEADQLGRSVADVGDVDGDGYDDVLFGASSAESGRGTVYLMHGPISAGATLSEAAAQITGADEQDYHGRSVAGLGDVTGDGLPDLGVGAWGSDAGETDAGAVLIYTGQRSGTLTADDADGALLGTVEGSFAGWSMDGAGDTNGDGYNDVLIGAYADAVQGQISLVLGPISGTTSLSDAHAILFNASSASNTGWSVSGPGDTDGDGLADILIGAPLDSKEPGLTESGLAWLRHGPLTGTQSMFSEGYGLKGVDSGHRAGFSVSGIDDRDGDGLPELFIGAYGADSAYLLRSDGVLPLPNTDLLSVSDWLLISDALNSEAGVAVGSAGDVNGDGRGDMLVGGPELDGIGGAWLIY
ncbi:MAG: MopE-related protein [Myxococcota bacterium]|nr:MopE-related protein [Myxococcota bacterium]